MSSTGQITTARELPAVEALAGDPALAELNIARPLLIELIREALDEARLALKAGTQTSNKKLIVKIVNEANKQIRRGAFRVINCAGALAHTNLGRAPFTREFFERISERLAGYSALEFDLATGKRGSRGDEVTDALCALTGAEAALVTNNCASAVFLLLNTFSARKETIVSRGELVQIGGGFRIPDILKKSGAKLVEVGTTNITTAADYENAISERSALLLKVSQSNFALEGFTQEASLAELAKLAAERELPLAYDHGSGLVVDPAEVNLQGKPTMQSALKAGCDIVCSSGDKVFGAVQAGLIVGKADFINRMRKNPLYRALRPDKITLAILAETLRAYLDGTWKETIPLWAQAQVHESELYKLGREIVEELGAGDTVTVEAVQSRYGGGALPDVTIPSCALSVNVSEKATRLAKRFRDLPTPIIGRVEDERFLLDLRTVLPEDLPALKSGLKSVLASLT